LSYANEQIAKGVDLELNNNDLENKKFWNAVEQILKLDSNDLIKTTRSKYTEEVTPANVVLFAQQCENSVSNWLKENKIILKEKAKLVVAKYDDQTIALSDATEIVNWYCSFLSKRILRSLKDLEERKTGKSEDPMNPVRDNIGSAKNTLIACNHVMAAFLLLYPQLEKHHVIIKSFVSDLIQIKSQILEIFPEAMQFKRPGFDK